jgi:hypothetical protein
MQDKEHETLLNRVIYYLYIKENHSAKVTAALLSISEPTVLMRIPKDEKKRAKRVRDYEAMIPTVLEMHKAKGNPKEIAFDLDIPLGRVYEILKKKEKKDDNKA